MTTAELARPAAKPARINHKGLALAVIVGAQLMVVLDATIVNIALPHIQTALDFTDTGLTWVLNAYTLTFGGLLLLGGRMGDILGRRRVFILGILIFILASLLGGFAQSESWLLAARALQGIGGAIASPTALALITTNFAQGPERNRAFGVYAAVSGSGAAIGLLAGGMLTDWLSWRWVLFVNVPIGLLIAFAAPLVVNESDRIPGRFDIGGALTSTLGMTALVYGFIHAAQDGWNTGLTYGAFAAAVVLLIAFVVVEGRSEQPVVPLRLFANRNRLPSYIVMLSLAAGMFGMFFFLTLFVQNVLGYSPIKAGLAFLPVSGVIIVVAGIVSNLVQKVGAKPLMVLGGAAAAIGLWWLSQLSVDSTYVGGLLGPMIVFAAGMGLLFVPLTVLAVTDVDNQDSGAASALLNVMQQVGGSIGLAVITTVFATAQRHDQTSQIKQFLAHATPAQKQQFAAGKLKPPQSVVNHVLAHGISTGLQAAVVFAIVAFLLTLVVKNVRSSGDGEAPGAPEEAAAGSSEADADLAVR